MSRQAPCPNCGGPIEFRLGASASLVCPWCRFSVVRSDRDLRALGKVADLVPTAPPLTVGDHGTVQAEGFTVLGRLQLDHGRGPWDEWHVAYEDRSNGWLARAQGQWIATKRVATSGAPPLEALAPGATGTLPGTGDTPWTVAERGESQLLSAEGELPEPVRPGERGRYADLVAPGGRFATVDYGDGSADAVVYAGVVVAPEAVALRGRGAGPRPVELVRAERLACPGCGAPVPLRVPETTERVVCAACGAALDWSRGALALASRGKRVDLALEIPLGREGRLDTETLTCAGAMVRSVRVDGERFHWTEYLLHSSSGYSWLVEDGGHFTWVRAVSAADVTALGGTATYGGRTYRLFASGLPQVDAVVGEFYWKVQRGDRAQTRDYVAPPHILSVEVSENEIVWSAGEYVAAEDVWAGFRLEGPPPTPREPGAAQPNPHRLGRRPAIALALAVALLAAFGWASRERSVVLIDGALPIPTVPEAFGAATAVAPGAPTPTSAAVLSGPFELGGADGAVYVELESDLGHGWIGAACALIETRTGTAHEVVLEQDRFHEGGLPRRAGALVSRARVAGLAPGAYRLRTEVRWGRKHGSAGEHEIPSARVRVRTAPRREVGLTTLGICLGLLCLPLVWTALLRGAFEGRRWANASPYEVA